MMKSTKKGSITVEAAIILPLFIIAVLTISYTVKLIEAEENVINGVADEARYIAAYAYIERTGIGVKSRIEKRVREDKAAEAFSVKRLGYLYSDFHNTGLISIDAAYTVRNRMPVKMRGDFHRKTGILFRGFVGRDNKGQIFSFDMMQTADDGTTVWVFPVAGERYHGENCSYIRVYPVQTILTDEVRKHYTPCRLCRPEEYGNGHIVYCFKKTGKAYHSAECSTVDRYVIEMTIYEAEADGYSRCMKCGGQ